jgi:hypothetical protein
MAEPVSQILVFVCEVETDQTTPAIGSFGDWVTGEWAFLDVRLAAIEPNRARSDVHERINRVLSDPSILNPNHPTGDDA